MKKRVLAMLLSALLAVNICACNYAPNDNPKKDINESTIDITESIYTKNESEQESITDANPYIGEGTIACNGVYRNSNVKYTITQEGNLILYIENWNESFVVPNEDMYFVFETLFASSVVIGDNRGALIYNDFSIPIKPIKIIRFAKGDQKVTIENLKFETSKYYAFKYCNFIDEQTGYLFLFNGEIQLSKLIKTTDGGQTWVEQSLNNIPTFYWRENIICAKMISENVGFISGSYYSDNFSSRTYITTDGGLTWSGIDIQYPKNSYELELGCEEACDMLYENGTYILICRFRSYREDGSSSYIWVKYTSTDLKTWTEVQ